jgi:hypothetical protein
MSRHRIRHTLMTLMLAGCGAGWHRTEFAVPSQLPERQQVQVWHGGKQATLHGVTVDSGWVYGVPYQQRLDCDSCEIAIPLREVDSVRLGNMERGGFRGMALVTGALVGFAVALASVLPND